MPSARLKPVARFRRIAATSARQLSPRSTLRGSTSQEPKPRVSQASASACTARALAYASESRALGVAARDLTMAIDAAGEMAVMHRSLGEIPESRAVSLERLALRQDLGRGDLYRDYRFLADLARDAGLVAEADEWADKADELLTGIAMGRIRAKGGFGSLQPVLQDLAAATVNARLHGRGIDDDRRHVLEELGKYGPPFSTLTNVLIEIAAGKPLRPIPGWMPAEIAEIIEAAQRELRGEPT